MEDPDLSAINSQHSLPLSAFESQNIRSSAVNSQQADEAAFRSQNQNLFSQRTDITPAGSALDHTPAGSAIDITPADSAIDITPAGSALDASPMLTAEVDPCTDKPSDESSEDEYVDPTPPPSPVSRKMSRATSHLPP